MFHTNGIHPQEHFISGSVADPERMTYYNGYMEASKTGHMPAWTYRALADAIVALHIAWTLLVFGGAVLMVAYPSYAFMEIFVLTVTLFSNLPFRLACPLTILERDLRRRIDPSYDNQNSFMATSINRIFGTHVTRRGADTVIGILFFLFYTYAVLMLIYA